MPRKTSTSTTAQTSDKDATFPKVGSYGPEVKRLQRERGLIPTGTWGHTDEAAASGPQQSPAEEDKP